MAAGAAGRLGTLALGGGAAGACGQGIGRWWEGRRDLRFSGFEVAKLFGNPIYKSKDITQSVGVLAQAPSSVGFSMG